MLALSLTAFPVQTDSVEAGCSGRIQFGLHIRQEQQLFGRQVDGLLNVSVAPGFLFVP